MVFDAFGKFRSLRIVPGCIRILIAIHLQRIITGNAFPWAGRMRVARLKIFLSDAIMREVVISFYDNSIIAFCDYLVVPNCFHFYFIKDKQFGCRKVRLINLVPQILHLLPQSASAFLAHHKQLVQRLLQRARLMKYQVHLE